MALVFRVASIEDSESVAHLISYTRQTEPQNYVAYQPPDQLKWIIAQRSLGLLTRRDGTIVGFTRVQNIFDERGVTAVVNSCPASFSDVPRVRSGEWHIPVPMERSQPPVFIDQPWVAAEFQFQHSSLLKPKRAVIYCGTTALLPEYRRSGTATALFESTARNGAAELVKLIGREGIEGLAEVYFFGVIAIYGKLAEMTRLFIREVVAVIMEIKRLRHLPQKAVILQTTTWLQAPGGDMPEVENQVYRWAVPTQAASL